MDHTAIAEKFGLSEEQFEKFKHSSAFEEGPDLEDLVPSDSFWEEYRGWRNFGYTHLEAYHQAVGYYRKHLCREYTFFEADDINFRHTSGELGVVELREIILKVLADAQDEIERKLMIVLSVMHGIDQFIGPEHFEHDPFYESLVEEGGERWCERRFTHKRAAELAGFSTKDKALKSYGNYIIRLRHRFERLGLSPNTNVA